MARTAIEIRTPDGTCPATVVRPAGEGPWPAVILYMDGIGPRPALYEMAERIGGDGYLVLVPDLFYRIGAYDTPDPAKLFSDPEMRNRFMTKFLPVATIANIMRDTGAFLEYLAGEPDVVQPKVGVTGYCMGGRLALSAAGAYPDRVVAAASFHGSYLASDAPDSPHLLAPRMRAKIYVGGADQDASFPPEMKQRLEEALTAAGVSHRVEIYAGMRHGFVPRDTPAHNPEGAERQFRELQALFAETLKRP
jgi:carboxymethylenebutenolidase